MKCLTRFGQRKKQYCLKQRRYAGVAIETAVTWKPVTHKTWTFINLVKYESNQGTFLPCKILFSKYTPHQCSYQAMALWGFCRKKLEWHSF